MRRLKYSKAICMQLSNTAVILSDGSITTCCVDSDGKNIYTNIKDVKFKTFLKNKPRHVLKKTLSSKMCSQCPYLIKTPKKYELEYYQKSLKQGPNILQIEVSAKCNYACSGCASNYLHKRRTPLMDLEFAYEKIETMLPEIEMINCFNYGEPLINPQLIDFIFKCRQKNPRLKIGLSTNGMLLTKEKAQKLLEAKVDWILFSLHGGPGTENMLKYSRRGADYEKVLENIKQLKELRDSSGSEVPKINMRAILFDWNDTDELMDKFRDDARKIGLTKPTLDWINDEGYHWLLDFNSPSERSSKRFLQGNEQYKWLKSRNEVC